MVGRVRLLTIAILLLPAGPARAQDEVRNFRMPVLMVETGGHHARVRSLLWQDDFTLLSGGEDKVVKVWDFHEDPRLARSIRPMIWRGSAGIIYAMAVSPRPDAQGQSFLAVAGFGIEAQSRRHHGLSHPRPGPHAHGRGGGPDAPAPRSTNPRRSATATR